ncbi:diaminopropionate ammonia-lyase [Leeia sp. TBRC 13508]|uniref:Diaminopropionate ammonia-lyase n=1 Tax=Leeia speluncae TaxID=2884804 RepID=A0ABS8DA43_9NEIS|nr:diaminopropionate ammonia-lyase [Leeia speluncae]MCB6185069.1 diaminopropionate ammonia-lyase [Leeia speluncae]
MLVTNQQAVRTAYPEHLQQILSIAEATKSQTWLASWPLIHMQTPLYPLPGLAKRLGIGGVSLKDEGARSALGSFKALGAPIALVRLIMLHFPDQAWQADALFAGKYQEVMRTFTVISATDGNHGRALAAAAQSVGCGCVIVLHANVSQEREDAIAAYGATIIRITGNYDDSVLEAARLAKEHGWEVVSDTSYDGYEDIPRDVMQGYGTIAAEILAQQGVMAGQPFPFTHVMLQGGVGGMAAGIASYLWEFLGAQRPIFIVVEPEQADCLLQSAIAGKAARATGSVDSVMAGLACGETSPLAWQILAPCVDHFITIYDEDAVQAMQWLASGSDTGDIPVVAGESGAAGVAGVMQVLAQPALRERLGLGPDAQVLVINSEGATAPAVYAECAKRTAADVLAAQAAWQSGQSKQAQPQTFTR